MVGSKEFRRCDLAVRQSPREAVEQIGQRPENAGLGAGLRPSTSSAHITAKRCMPRQRHRY